MEIKIVKVVNDETYEDSKGFTHKKINYYVVLNGQYVAIRPSFHEGYKMLDIVATVVKNGKQN